MNNLLKGRSAIITGASQGLGREIAQAYVTAGASVFLCARNEIKLGNVVDELKSHCNGDQKILGMKVDVSEPNDVKRFVEFAINELGQIQILVNNAGVYGPKGKIEEVDWNKWVKAVEINLLGSILVAKEIIPHLRENRYGKIIQLSGGGATSPLPYISAYATSKAGIVRFVETLAGEVRDDNIDVNSIAPGALNTSMLDEVLEAGPEQVGEQFYKRAKKQKQTGGIPLEKGAQLAVFLASSKSDGITGKLISAVWDPWDKLDDHLEDLQKTDIYTLRRIVPEDRGLKWGRSSIKKV